MPNTPTAPLPFLTQRGFPLAERNDGPLAGLRVAVKDLFDIAGMKTGAGNPTWLAVHTPATGTAEAVRLLLSSGATLVGKALTDELAYSLTGDNIHYGTPLNAAAPDRLPGGSSSGSASAVSLGLADIGLGTDTGGSIRIPSSFCGLYGLRPTHGAVSTAGLIPLAPRFDTVGWMTRDAETLGKVGDVLLPEATPKPFERLLIAEPLFATLPEVHRAALAPVIDRLRDLWPQHGLFDAVTYDELADAAECFRILQAREAWHSHGGWISRHRPEFAPGIADRFEQAARISDADVSGAEAKAASFVATIRDALGEGTLLCLPTAPDIAPLRASDPAALAGFRSAAMRLTCIAGLAGLPQLHLPCAEVNGVPFGLSLIAPAGCDRALLATVAETVTPALPTAR